MRDFWIDTDTASDDAVALVMALRSPDIFVRGISTVAGNVSLEQGTRNALFVAELCGQLVPVFPGADAPLVRRAEDAAWFHGRDGLSEMNYPAPARSAESIDGVSAMIRAIHDAPGIVLVTLGPLTNLAMALLRDPAIVQHVSRCVVMGGNPCCVGNVTPAAEYNIWCDPEAAEIVFRSGLPIELVGWHLCRGEANLRQVDIDRIRSIHTPLAHFVIDCNRIAARANETQTGEVGIPLPDPTAMAIALHPALARVVTAHALAVECQSDLTRGMTVIDQLQVSNDARNRGDWKNRGRGNVVWEMDVGGFKRLLIDLLESAKR